MPDQKLKVLEIVPGGGGFFILSKRFYITCRKTQFERITHYNIKSKVVGQPAYLRGELVRVPSGATRPFSPDGGRPSSLLSTHNNLLLLQVQLVKEEFDTPLPRMVR